MKLASSAYIASLGRLWSAGGGLEGIRASYQLQRVPLWNTDCRIEEAEVTLSTLMVIFVSDSRSRIIRTLSVLRNEYNTSRSFFRQIISNALDKSISSISITYIYRWHFASTFDVPIQHLLLTVRVKIRFGLAKGGRSPGRRSGAM